MIFMNVDYGTKELFIATIVYCFIFSQIVASGFKMIITRYIADRIYERDFKKILPSLYGVLSVVVLIAGIIGIAFYWNSPLPLYIKLVSYLLFMELVIVFVMMEYLSTVKDYMRIVKCFISGLVVVSMLSIVFLEFTELNIVFALLLAMDIGFLVIISIMMGFLFRIYGKPRKRYYDFLKYFDRFPALFFISFFYTLGLYSHNFIFWTSKLGVQVSGTYVYAPTYDVPTFYAFLSIMPAMVIFVVSIETNFYDKYRNYYSLITGKGNLTDIETARKDMTHSLWAEIRNIMELQLFFTLVFMALGHYILPRLGLTQLSMDIFNLVALGAYMNIIMMIIMLVLLYFEDRSGALFIAGTFLISNIVFTYLTVLYSESVYGTGFFVATLVSLVVAITELLIYLRNINYHTFCGQPVIYIKKEGIFGRIIDSLSSRKK
jgi:uncharacterized membrane protein